jgi:hypothetical protein
VMKTAKNRLHLLNDEKQSCRDQYASPKLHLMKNFCLSLL